MPLSSGSGMAPGPDGMSGWCTLSGMRGVLPASCAVWRSEHTSRQPDGDHTARPRHSQPTCRTKNLRLCAGTQRRERCCLRAMVVSQVAEDALAIA